MCFDWKTEFDLNFDLKLTLILTFFKNVLISNFILIRILLK